MSFSVKPNQNQVHNGNGDFRAVGRQIDGNIETIRRRTVDNRWKYDAMMKVASFLVLMAGFAYCLVSSNQQVTKNIVSINSQDTSLLDPHSYAINSYQIKLFFGLFFCGSLFILADILHLKKIGQI